MDLINLDIDTNNNNNTNNKTSKNAIIQKLHLKRPPPKSFNDDFYLSKYKNKKINSSKNNNKNEDNCICF